MNLQFLPYFTSKAYKDRVSPIDFKNDNGITGLDVRYGITTNLTAVLTVNPDFAQIEADEDKINLSRYPYILKEKRPFFLEGAAIFNTAGNSMSNGEYQTALFYSRRINEPVYGLKTTGKIGNWDIGVLHALNDNDVGVQEKIENGELSETSPAQAYYNVVRLSKDIFSRSQIGMIAMSKEYSGNFNRTFGFDSRIRLKNNYTFAFEGVKSFTNIHHKDNHSVNIYFYHNSDIFNFSYWYQEQAANFNGSELGFYEYNNFRNAGSWMQFAPRLEKIGIRKMYNNINYWGENFQNKNYLDYNTLSRGFNYNVYIKTMNYWGISFSRTFSNYYDRFDEILYPSSSYSSSFQNSNNSPICFRASHSQGKYRTGYRWSYNGYIRIRPENRFKVQFSYNRSLVKVINQDSGEMENSNYEIWSSKFYYHVNRNLNARLILQYNGMEKRLDTYYLLAYNFKPGSFLYLAYTERFDSDLYLNFSGMEMYPKFGSSYKILQLKLSYLLQV